ncbi:MAG: hypothetical protein HYV09_05170 [Deltaproteobacteria bacterium]|nr:hypothetical protein [Deltaproteobacteria bacterium]
MSGSLATHMRERLTALRAVYSAISVSFSAWADCRSDICSSWKSTTVMVISAIDDSTSSSATPRSFPLRLRRREALVVGGSRSVI